MTFEAVPVPSPVPEAKRRLWIPSLRTFILTGWTSSEDHNIFTARSKIGPAAWTSRAGQRRHRQPVGDNHDAFQ
jgi:hypothetical protein